MSDLRTLHLYPLQWPLVHLYKTFRYPKSPAEKSPPSGTLMLDLISVHLKLEFPAILKPQLQGPSTLHLLPVSHAGHPRAKCWVFLYLANAVGVNFLFLFPPSSSLLPLQFLSKVGLLIMSGLFHDPGADHHLSD